MGLEHSFHEEVYQGHGRLETHRVYTILHPAGIRDQALWKDLKAITLIVSQRQGPGQEESGRIALLHRQQGGQGQGLCELCPRPLGYRERPALDPGCELRRGSLPHALDHSAENMALLRRLALSLLKQHGGKGSVRAKRKRSGWDDRFLVEILSRK